MRKRKWYKLDNVGKFYSFTSKNKIPAVFRYSVTMNQQIEPMILQKALDEVLEEFNNFHVHLKRGFFWYYLENTNKKVLVEEENIPICTKIYRDSDDVLFRINYFKCRINLEVSHILSDGRGSLQFFKALIYKYLKLNYSLKTVELSDNSSIYEKAEDSFDKYYTKDKIQITKSDKVYKYRGKTNNSITYMEYHLPVDQVLDIAHSYNTSLTSLLIAVLIMSYKEEMKEVELGQVIKIDVPVDLRRFFNSSTSRNFFGLASISYKYESFNDNFDDVVKSVSEQLKSSTTIEKLKIRMNQMISFEKNIFARITPIFIKNLVLIIADKLTSDSCTSCLSNIGKIEVDSTLEKYIKNFNVLSTTGSLKLTICSYKNDLSIGISSKYESNNIINTFCHFFADRDINGVLNINWSDEDEEM